MLIDAFNVHLLASMRMLSQQKDFRMHVKPVLDMFVLYKKEWIYI